MQVAGPLTVDGMPADVQWDKPLGPGTSGSRITLQAPLSQPLAASFGVPLQPAQMRGAGQLRATVDLRPAAPPALDLSADLSGAAISVPGLGWSKSAAQGGTLALSGRLGAAPQFDRLRLQAPGMLAEGSLAIAASGGLAALDLTRLSAGAWIDAPLRLRPTGAKRFDVALAGGQLDLRNLPKSGGGGGGGNPLATARLDGTRVVVSDTLALTGVSGSLDLQRQGAGDLRGRVNGKAPVTVELRETQSGPRIRIRAPDAGAVAVMPGCLPRAAAARCG